ncbi:KxYKxGKxW signal peptide domain-containing protein, partial [Schleiferilactobacillus harbinensis]|uniref:KxYKxGKxW signal peptide domain-containing protein n=1 Tax=Schleiferilactobacillus harbinensis TaxID=304207 RepID=UPI002432A517
MSGKKTRFKLHKSHKRWMVIGVSAIALLGGLMQAKPVHAALNSVGTVNYVKGWNTVVWQRNNGMHMTNNWLPTNSRWRTYGAVQTDDKQYFLNVGGNQWVGDKYFDLDDETSWQTLRGVVTISDAPNEGTPVWNSPYADRIQTDHQPLKNGSRWQTYLRAVVNGQTWYNLGGKQWIQGSSAQITQEQLRGPKHYISGSPSLIDGGGTNVAVKTHYSVVAKDVYGNVLQTNFFTANVGDRAYINAPTIPGYDVLAPSSQSIVLGNDTNQNEIIFKYTPHYAPPTPPIKPTQTTVHIRFVDSDGNTITTVDQDATIGGQFNYQAPKEFQHDGKTYQLVGDGKINLPNVTGNERPTVEYQLQTPIPATTSVTVRAVDSDGKVLDGDLATVDVNNDQLAGYEYTLKPGQ